MTPLELSEPKIVWPGGAILGEGPVWSTHQQALYWVDIKGLKLHRFSPVSGVRQSWICDEPVGCIDAPDADGALLAATRSGFAELWLQPDGSARRRPIKATGAETRPGHRFNDGKRAPDGSFWAGAMDDSEATDAGVWWRLDPHSGEATMMDEGYRVPNGPAFDPTRNRVYLTDSARQTVYVREFNSEGPGFLRTKSVFLKFGEGDGYPDGMQVHSDGSLWIAFWDAACVRRFAPSGALIQQIDLPVTRPTSLALAPELSALFVTSASIGLEDDGRQGGLVQLHFGSSVSGSASPLRS